MRWKRWPPRLVLHEKYEPGIKWTLRVLLIIGVLTSVVSLPWYQSLPFALALLFLEQFLERSVLLYTSIYLHTMPDFAIDPAKWVSMAFIVYEAEGLIIPNEVGLVFTDEEYAQKFFELLHAWNQGKNEDKDNNVQLSFIIDEEVYYLYIYPNPTRESVMDFFTEIQKLSKLEKYGKEHLGIVPTLMICRSFSTTRGYSLGVFLEKQQQGEPFLLRAYLQEEGPQPKPIQSIEPIIKWNYKAKARAYLNEEDLEYFHWNKVIRP